MGSGAAAWLRFTQAYVAAEFSAVMRQKGYFMMPGVLCFSRSKLSAYTGVILSVSASGMDRLRISGASIPSPLESPTLPMKR